MADDKKELDPVKVGIFIGVLVLLGIIFTADDLTGVGLLLDPIEFLITLLVGAGYGGKVGFWKKSGTTPSQDGVVPTIEGGRRKEDLPDDAPGVGRNDIVVNAKDVTDRLRICPFCGERLKFKKEPKFCPYCEEGLVNKAP